MLENFAYDTTITTTNNKNLLWVGVSSEREVCDHLLVTVDEAVSIFAPHGILSDLREFIALCALDHAVQYEHISIGLRFEDQYILVQGLFHVQDAVDFESHGLPRPLRGDLAEPTIWIIFCELPAAT